jgi:hypothetical protein
MKKFALFAMLICASAITFGCAEKKKETPKTTDPAATAPAEGEKPAEPAK